MACCGHIARSRERGRAAQPGGARPNLNLAGVVAVIEPHDRGDRCVLHLTGFCLQK
jgi:hypothetical protein